jgi:uncharacterized protein YfdQ (DUF2303 family)
MPDFDTLISAIVAATDAGQEVRTVPGHDNLVYTIGAGGRPIIADLSALTDKPTAKRGNFTLTAPADFAAYVTAHTADGTAVFVEPRAGRAIAILDGHGTDPGHGNHTARMNLARTASWQRITRHTDGAINQEQFANWLDDIREEVRGIDTDELVDLIDNLHIFANASQKEVRATGHGKSLAFAEDVTIKAGKAGVELPNKITVESTVFDGVDKAWRFEIRLSVVASPGNPTKFRLSIPRLDDVLEAATAEAMAVVRDGIGDVPIYAGSGSHDQAPHLNWFTV